MVELSPTFTREVRVASFELPHGATYLSSGALRAERSVGDLNWVTQQRDQGSTIADLSEGLRQSLEVNSGDSHQSLDLHDQTALAEWLSTLPAPVYIDVTLLSLSIWAPILRAVHFTGISCRYLYVEPLRYSRRSPQTDFSLSEYTGIGAVPGFARIESTENESPPLIPLLGFEGPRFSRIINALEPPIDLTHPIVGVPGYRLEYPFFTYIGNRLQLEERFLHSRVVMARANCPFDAYAALASIHSVLGGGRVQVAPIGTKPHALGAVLYTLANDGNAELVYDHPTPTERPTEGASRVCIYFVSEFLKSELFAATSYHRET